MPELLSSILGRFKKGAESEEPVDDGILKTEKKEILNQEDDKQLLTILSQARDKEKAGQFQEARDLYAGYLAEYHRLFPRTSPRLILCFHCFSSQARRPRQRNGCPSY